MEALLAAHSSPAQPTSDEAVAPTKNNASKIVADEPSSQVCDSLDSSVGVIKTTDMPKIGIPTTDYAATLPTQTKPKPNPPATTDDLPTPKEVSEYAEYLGLVPGEDGPLLWVAELALCAPVPEGYRELEDHLGKTFYLDSETNEAAWEHPFDEDYRMLYRSMRAALAYEIPTKVEVYAMAKYLGIVPEHEPRMMWIAKQASIAPMPEAWEEKEDEAGIYYHDVVNNITTRVHPLDDIFKLLVDLERSRPKGSSLFASANFGEDEGHAPTLLCRDDGSTYIYDWVTGEEADDLNNPGNNGEDSSQDMTSAQKESNSPITADSVQGEADQPGRGGPSGEEEAVSAVRMSLSRAPLTSRKAGIARKAIAPKESGGGGLGGMMKRSGSSSLAKSVIAKHAARQNTQKSVKTTPSMGPLGLMLYIMFSPYYLLAWLLSLVRMVLISPFRYLLGRSQVNQDLR
eukprot:CAMPEP_0114291370 /NCGR_PEP_ID=MMETSP0059-20121206/8450_1 /TAXON_ID=36894 /ORGANISM="Pyramimonas parkeae, Strain CCMP726" /LENGTH=457 /DNA_ID=CAMNT_0001412863 /DNA_START=24 /DNA_END=1397 /DNA_ORIENTATION=-